MKSIEKQDGRYLGGNESEAKGRRMTAVFGRGEMNPVLPAEWYSIAYTA
jgi:hypothetical protein